AAIAMPTGHFVLTTRIYAALGHYDVRMACAMSVALVLLTAISLFVHNALLRGKRYTVTTSESRRRRFISLGRWWFPIAAALLLFFAATTLLPLATIFLTSFLKAWGLAPTPENLTLGNYAKVVTEDLASRALRNSLVFASTGATLATLLGLIAAYISVRTRMVGRKVIDFLATMPSAIPGPVLAAAMIFAWMNPPVSLYNTPWIIIVAYVTAFLPYAVRNVAGVLEGMDPTLEEMGWVSGASWARTMRNITVPLIGRGLWAGWILVFLMAFREIALSTMLYTQGTETVGAVLFMLKSETGGLEVVSAVSVVVMVITIAGQLLVEKLGIMRRSGAL
nr:iron ABC transporter permease [Anaerolineales bacterium]